MAAITAVAVTGDVGAGKSTVARLFESLGGVRFDADAVVAELWRRPDIVGAAVGRWGSGILDSEGRVVFAHVAARLFSSRAEYDWGCALLHPPTRAELARRVASLDPKRDWAVAEIPMLFESGVPDWVTATVFVTASRDVRAERAGGTTRSFRGGRPSSCPRRNGPPEATSWCATTAAWTTWSVPCAPSISVP